MTRPTEHVEWWVIETLGPPMSYGWRPWSTSYRCAAEAIRWAGEVDYLTPYEVTMAADGAITLTPIETLRDGEP